MILVMIYLIIIPNEPKQINNNPQNPLKNLFINIFTKSLCYKPIKLKFNCKQSWPSEINSWNEWIVHIIYYTHK